MKQFPTLFKRAHTGKIQQWTMIVNENTYYTIAGQVGGKLTQTRPSTAEPKNTGKKNETSASDQALSEAQSKYDFKLEHGYTTNIKAVDSTGYQEPMRAKDFRDYKEVVKYPVFVDDKLNGIRCWTVKNDPRSRTNKPFNTLKHIQEELAVLYKKYPKLYLDGELFNPKLKNKQGRIDLGDMASLVSVAIQPKDVTQEILAQSRKLVQYHIYDGFGYEDITTETPFKQRRDSLKKLLKGFKYLFVLNYDVCYTFEEIDKLLAKSKKELREGIIIRWGDCPYRFQRTNTLLKYKNWITEEFEIVDIQEGDGDWKGLAKRVVYKLPKTVINSEGKEQTTSAAGIEGNMERARQWWRDRDKLIGKLGSITFGEYSKYGIPLTPVLETVRDYE
jgi:DNA ligase-1